MGWVDIAMAQLEDSVEVVVAKPKPEREVGKDDRRMGR